MVFHAPPCQPSPTRSDLMGNTAFDAIAIFLLIAPGRVLQNRLSTNSLQKPLH